MGEYTSEKERLAGEEAAALEREREATAGLQECAKQLDLIATKNTAIQRKRDELNRRFAEIGALPADAFERYQSLSAKALEKKLVQCNAELKKYGNVNKKALDQFVQFSEHRDRLLKRQEELERAHKVSLSLSRLH